MKMHVMALALLAGAGAGAAGAQPQAGDAEADWVEYAADAESRTLLDRRSIHLERGILRYRGRILYAQADEHGIVELRSVGEIDCAARSYRTASIVAYDAAGGVIVSDAAGDEAVPIGPGSINETLYAERCR